MKAINLAIVGATGLVGRKFLEVLEEKSQIKIKNLYLFASAKSAGKQIVFRGKPVTIIELNEENIKKYKIDYALFSAGGGVSATYAPIFAVNGTIVIDNSSAWRMDTNVPLIVPQVNPEEIEHHQGIIANPNCSTIQCMLPLQALKQAFGLKKVSYSTYQAVSGSGQKGIMDLERTTNGEAPSFYPYPIFNNCIPCIDSFLDNGYTEEEMKMINETRKILNLPELEITATCVRVPVMNSHCVETNIELSKDFEIDEIYKTLSTFPNIVIADDPAHHIFPVPTMATGSDKVFVGRIRRTLSNPKGLHIFCVADNVRKGAASNAVEILELFLK